MALTTLGTVLLNANELSVDGDLFPPYDEVRELTTSSTVIPVDRHADNDDLPGLAAQNVL